MVFRFRRELQRNIEQICYEFGIEIKYDKTQNGYYIDKEESFNYDAFMKFLEIAHYKIKIRNFEHQLPQIKPNYCNARNICNRRYTRLLYYI